MMMTPAPLVIIPTSETTWHRDRNNSKHISTSQGQCFALDAAAAISCSAIQFVINPS